MSLDATETIDALIARYAAGTLPAPAHVLVAAHLELRDERRAMARGLEHLSGSQLEDETPRPLSDRDRLIEAALAAPSPLIRRSPPVRGVFPRALRDFVGFEAEDTPWRTKLPGFREFDVGEMDGCCLSLFWLRPGRRIPAHTHGGTELTLVLDGAFTDTAGRYGRGDIALADETVDHRPTAENDRPCIGVAVTDAPLRLTGPLGQRLMDIIRG